MRFAVILLTALIGQAPASSPGQSSTEPANAAGPKPVATMRELMLKIVYPYSDAIFYVEREAPKNVGEWMTLETKTLALAEMGNLLMSPGRAYNQDQWMKDAQLLVNVGNSAYKAAQARNLQGLVALNAELYESCQSCHEHFRPGYRRRQ
jgi:hypothetical protein